ncbi:hypothetical protein Q3G72_018395 [Acer saccharum]|nr:hypothetical protein Q3G72_018395 [Acer saccharum]
MFLPRHLLRFGRGKQPQFLYLNQKPLLGVSRFNEPGNLSRLETERERERDIEIQAKPKQTKKKKRGIFYILQGMWFEYSMIFVTS